VVPGASRFMVLSSGSWFLSQGIKPIGASVRQYVRTDKSFDWYAEYAEPDLDQSVRITGHLRGLAPNYTISFAASGVEVADTLRLAGALKPVDQAAWKKAGGLVIDCPPGGDACPN
jgi:hypothetical protein